jgi:rubrerythrin
MSRPKSEKTIQLEREREIRQQRREQKKIERERRAAFRAEKKRRHEVAISGKTIAVASSPIISIQEIIMNGSSHYFCETCKTAKKEAEMKTHDICESCFYSDLSGGNLDKAKNDDFTPLCRTRKQKLSLNIASGDILGRSTGHSETTIQRRAIDSKRPSKGGGQGEVRGTSPQLNLADGRGE